MVPSHPWITFALDSRRLGHIDWLNLGEAVGAVAQVADAPLDAKLAEDFRRIYLAKGALATTAIEGNTLSEPEALAAVEGTLTLPPSQQYLKTEITNIVDLSNELLESIRSGERVPFTVEHIAHWNAAILRGLELNRHVVPGTIRTIDVRVGPYRPPAWQEAHPLLERLCEALREFEIPEENRLAFVFLKAVFAHVHLAWIHPFGDGNGRIARLVEQAILLEGGFPDVCCQLLSNHYDRTRHLYYLRLAESSTRKNGVDAFYSYAIAGFVEQLAEQVETIRERHLEAIWFRYLDDQFPESASFATRRQRELARAVAHSARGVSLEEMPFLTPSLARTYASHGSLSSRTLYRDVGSLVDRNLLIRDAGGVRANWGVVVAFRSGDTG